MRPLKRLGSTMPTRVPVARWRTALAAAVFFVGLAPFSAEGETINEFPIPGGVAVDVVAGPDGNLWFTQYYVHQIGKRTPAGVITQFTVPPGNSTPSMITAGPDGNLWFTDYDGNQIGRMTTAGTVTQFALPTAFSGPSNIVAGPDGNLWFTENSGNRVGRITVAGAITEFTVPTAISQPRGIAAGPDGNLWFAEEHGNKIAKITPTGVITEFSVPTANSWPSAIATGPDGNLWFTESYAIGRITTAGAITEFPVPASPSQPMDITTGRDGNLWYTDNAGNKISRITTTGVITEFPIPTANSRPQGIATGPDGNLWFAEANALELGQLVLVTPKGDFNNDGQPDMLFRNVANGTQNKVWHLDGASRLSEVFIMPQAASTDWLIRGVDDFDNAAYPGTGRDRIADLVFWNQVTGNVEFWLMNGATRVGSPVPLTGDAVLPTDWELSATSDFNHDDKADIVWRHLTSGNIVIWTMNGTVKTGMIVPSPAQAVNSNWVVVATADYDGDGNTDFLWYNLTSGKIVTWYMDAMVARTTGQFTTPAAAADANWKVVASADYSHDLTPTSPGSPDIVWRNATSGNQVIWHLDFASHRLIGQFTNPAANTTPLDWTIVGPR